MLKFDEPNHVAVSWHLDAEFQYDPDPEHASRVDGWFTAEIPTRTRVELLHSHSTTTARRGADSATASAPTAAGQA